jgi:hypothetical protein
MEPGDQDQERQPLGAGGSATLFLVFLAILILSPVRQVSDASYSLLVSECLLRHGTFALDAYVRPPLDPAVHPTSADGELPYHLVEAKGHVYYRYPPGTPILSVPFVALSHLFGMSAVDPGGGYDSREERRMMFRLAALLMACLALVVYRTAGAVLSRRWSLVFTTAVLLTTQVWSTASRGLWSHTWAILLVSLAVLELVRHETLGRRLRPVLLASILSWAYFTRPTMAVGVAAVGVYLALRCRRALAPFAATVAGWLTMFVAASWWQFGRLLPPYYRPTKLGTPELWTGLAGNLVSPGRGLLVYLPHLLMVAYWLIRYRRRSALAPLAALGVSAAAGHLLVVASFPIWWGGECFGPRLMTDAVPWLTLPSLLAVEGWLQASADRRSRGARFRLEAAAAVALTLAALAIHATGALSASTNSWNWTPVSVDHDPSRVWDWGDAQFLAPFRATGNRESARGLVRDLLSAELAAFLLPAGTGCQTRVASISSFGPVIN